MTDWLFWICGGVLGLAGLLLLAWSLYSDRPKGRRRCPKCWYDMSGAGGDAPWTCPECGKVIAKETRLHRTRRRWRWAIVAVIAVVAALIAEATPKVREGGVGAVLPASVLSLMYRHLTGHLRADAEFELYRRIYTPDANGAHSSPYDRLKDWQWRMLARGALREMKSPETWSWDDGPDGTLAIVAESGIAPPVDVIESIVEILRRPDRYAGSSLLYSTLRPNRPIQGWLLDHHEIINESILGGLQWVSDPSTVRDALVIRRTMHDGDLGSFLTDALQTPSAMKNETCLQAHHEYIREASIPRKYCPWDITMLDQAEVDIAVTHMGSEYRSVRIAAQYILITHATDEHRQQLIDSIHQSCESIDTWVNKTKVQRTIEIIDALARSEPSWTALHQEKVSIRHLDTIERLWKIDAEFGITVYADLFHRCYNDVEEILIRWMNKHTQSAFAPVILTTRMLDEDPCHRDVVPQMILALDIEHEEARPLLEQLNNEWEYSNREAAKEALEQLDQRQQ